MLCGPIADAASYAPGPGPDVSGFDTGFAPNENELAVGFCDCT